MSTQSTVTLQQIVDQLQMFADLEPIIGMAGSSLLPMLKASNDVMTAICGVPFPHKWNEKNYTPFYTNSWQQDYAVVNPDGSSITDLAWLERGIAVDINSTAFPKAFREVECGRQLPQQSGTNWNTETCGTQYLCNWFPNNTLYYGTWGAGNLGTVSVGNNPQPGSSYTNPLGCAVIGASWSGGQITFVLDYIPSFLSVGGTLIVSTAFPVGYNNSFTILSISGLNVMVTSTLNPGTYEAGGVVGAVSNPNQPINLSMPANPITQIEDANGNLLVLTQYGTEGTTAPLATANATAGTQVSGAGATTVWTVVDPYGQGFRILPVPSQTGTVWQISLTGQMKPVKFTSLSQTIFPLPDQFEKNFTDGVTAQLYRYSAHKDVRAKFKDEWTLWLTSLTELRAKQDRELEENTFTLDRGIMGGWSGRNRFKGPQWPFNYPTS